mmetsp:Transcript_8720/g.20001  ORF Transcript_8720/g.20001 Transcript_8720/m.20001 type:complete len:543 (-) Transcript_8720:232-1860(-)
MPPPGCPLLEGSLWASPKNMREINFSGENDAPASWAPSPTSDASTEHCAAERREHAEEVEELDRLFSAVYPLVRQYELENASPDDTKVVEYQTPAELLAAMDFSTPDVGSEEEFVRGCRETLRYSVRTSHPRFMWQLFAGSDPAGQVGELVTAAVNTSMHTFAAAPVFTVMERQLIVRVAERLRMDTATIDGVFAPGGSYANMVAMLVARNEKFPHVREDGWEPADRPVAFTSVQSHYSIKKAAMITGMGSKSVVEVAADATGAMIPEELEKALAIATAAGKTPFFVSCTAGTTVTGAFDPLRQIKAVCQRHGVWMHVDGSWGGSVLMSEEHRGLLDGAEGADSFCFNPHKLLGVPMQCSVVLVNGHVGALERSNSTVADYLFHQSADAKCNLGQKSLQCGRKPDCLKLWLAWKRYGTKGLGHRVDLAMANAALLADKVKADPRFHLLIQPQSCQVCFFYLPPSLRARAAAEGVPALYAQLDGVTQAVCVRMQRAGSVMVNFSPLPDQGLPHFIRAVMIQPRVMAADIDFMLEEIDRLGRDL